MPSNPSLISSIESSKFLDAIKLEPTIIPAPRTLPISTLSVHFVSSATAEVVSIGDCPPIVSGNAPVAIGRIFVSETEGAGTLLVEYEVEEGLVNAPALRFFATISFAFIPTFLF